MSEETNGEVRGDDGGGRQRTMRVNYPSNSQRTHAQKQRAVQGEEGPAERPKLGKVVDGEATIRKRGVIGRFVHGFVSEDADTVFGWLAMEVLLPAAKNMISDMFSQGVDRVLYGDSRPSRGSRQGAYTNYSRFGTGATTRASAPDPRPTLSREARTRHEFDEILIQTRAEAQEVLDTLRELIERYDVATVADLYDLAGITGEFTDNKWGWYDLRTARVRQIRGGYVVDLPRTEPIT